ncbi:nuclear transport factor 2 family protein [Zunongwangia atlantica]|uniref:DUF4440 domain-containing protein n=1 Tax=Zunongwangia atlantica 22II14-10F7 TaxID=1185767 RepID=A0A1Y1SZ49_9FLAO|nr:nuclear transport factor 2 family protein [Zunongwangia atlantica]ORL43513.1 hypothetical protein IIF7_20439 [Zunongwangia atlantica 22II14-10F7]
MYFSKIKSSALIIFIFLSYSLSSQNDQLLDLKYDIGSQIQEMDSLLFDVAFNQCNLELFKKIISKEIEFYDDRTGLNTSFEREISSFQDKCSKPISITRKLVESSVHALGNFCAVQLGTHEFYANDKKVERAKFITVWERKDDSWIVKRVISYDHKPISE